MNTSSVVLKSSAWVRWITGIMLLLAWGAYLRLPRIGAPADAASGTIVWPEVPSLSGMRAEVFNLVHGSAASDRRAADGAERFKLAGTFYQVTETGDSTQRQMAIIDDQQSGVQYLLHQGQIEQGLKINAIHPDRVSISYGGKTRELTLNLGPVPQPPRAAAESTAADEPDIFRFDDLEAIKEGPFGKQVAPDRWVLKREALLEYQAAMLQDPERLANLYLSWQTDFDQNNRVAGFQLQPMGEQAFFQEMGMQSGDVIRKVNSMEMVNQRRAEYFIRTFTENKLPTVVLEVEREGKPARLIYHIR